jgi:preprotein translocase subunit YajC
MNMSEEFNRNGVPRSRIAELAVGDEILIGPDFHATILAVRDGKFDIETEYGRLMRITAAAIEAIP